MQSTYSQNLRYTHQFKESKSNDSLRRQSWSLLGTSWTANFDEYLKETPVTVNELLIMKCGGDCEGMVRESGEMDFHTDFEASSCLPFFS